MVRSMTPKSAARKDAPILSREEGLVGGMVQSPSAVRKDAPMLLSKEESAGHTELSRMPKSAV